MATFFDSFNALQIMKDLWGNPIAQNTAVAVITGYLVFQLNHMLSEWVVDNYSTGRPWDWSKEIVLVTGGSSGIGEAVVSNLAKRRIKVIIFDVQPPKDPPSANVYFYKVDVTKSESVSQAAESLRQDVGHPTVLLNNAGVAFPGDVLSAREDQVRRVFEINTISHFILAKEFVPDMVKNDHGHVVTVSSMASFAALAGNVPYCCTKASCMAFSEGLRQDLIHVHKTRHVRTSIIHPGFVKTPMSEPVIHKMKAQDIDTAEAVAGRIVEQILRGRSGRVLMPSHLWAAPLVRGMPAWIQEWVRNSRASINT